MSEGSVDRPGWCNVLPKRKEFTQSLWRSHSTQAHPEVPLSTHPTKKECLFTYSK